MKLAACDFLKFSSPGNGLTEDCGLFIKTSYEDKSQSGKKYRMQKI